MSDKGVSRTALATLGLLNIVLTSMSRHSSAILRLTRLYLNQQLLRFQKLTKKQKVETGIRHSNPVFLVLIFVPILPEKESFSNL